MGEIWKNVVGYEGIYEVSNLGRVHSLPRIIDRGRCNEKWGGRIMKQTLCKKTGYFCVGLFKDRKRKLITIHRLVAMAFHPNPQNKKCVNHIDSDRTNNKSTNLEWATHSENLKHAVKANPSFGSWAKGRIPYNRKFSETDIGYMRFLRKYLSLNFLAQYFQCHKKTVHSIVTYKTYK